MQATSVNTEAQTMQSVESGAVHSILRSGARLARIPFNSMTLRRYAHMGLPEDLYPAVEFWLTNRRGHREREVARRVEALRTQLSERGSLTVAAYGAAVGDPSTNGSLAIEDRSLEYVARRASVPERMGLFLYLCASGFGARHILELGACAGISGCYLASAPSCRDFVSIEISTPLVAIARHNLSRVTTEARVINADFDRGLDEALSSQGEHFDLVWIDGNHLSEPTLDYFTRVRDRVAPGQLILFDDINWPEMRSAWSEIRAWPGFSHTINFERFGIGVLKRQRDDTPPENWSLKRRLGFTALSREQSY